MYGIHPSNDLPSRVISQASSSRIPTHVLQYPICISSYLGITIETVIRTGILLVWKAWAEERKKMDGRWMDARARADNVCPCCLHFDHSTAGHADRRRLHCSCRRHHNADRPDYQLARRHAAFGYSPQRQTTSIPTTLGVSHKPTPASVPASAITQPNPCMSSSSVLGPTDVRATRRVSRIPPRTAPTGRPLPRRPRRR